MPDPIHDLPGTNVCLVETPPEPVKSVCVAADDWDLDLDFQPSSAHAIETAPEPKDDGQVDVRIVEMPDTVHDLPGTNVCLVETPPEPVKSVCVAADDWDIDLDFQPSPVHAIETAPQPKDSGGVDVCIVEMPDLIHDLLGTSVCLVETPPEPVKSVCVAADDWLDFQPSSAHTIEAAPEPKDDGQVDVRIVEMPDPIHDLRGTNVCLVETRSESVKSVCVAADDWDFDLNFQPSSATNGNSSVSIAWPTDEAKRSPPIKGSCKKSACDKEDPLWEPGTCVLEFDVSSRPHPAKHTPSKHPTKSPPRRAQQPLAPVGLPRRKPHKADHLDLDDLLNF
ncbi:MAG: uncharacterized protein KVP18_001429 [Porospora cf. gigantea A]|uniref:uncharacterized protein n=1 Tax=Porospora cf. gigantea A TaxID=2853593 RepID=UPI00355A4ADD|nr:MAG: hypothetical protein KVP18_001429 [Porospora cf. gigantea A]